MKKKFNWLSFTLLNVLLVNAWAVQAQIMVKGKVTDTMGPIAGVNVYEKGTDNGTSSNADGSYSIKCNDNATLIFSFLGFKTEEVEVKGRQNIDVVLSEDVTTLQNIEIVGSRNANRSSLDTPVPVDIVDLKSVSTMTGQLNINQLLQVITPSFNSNPQTGSDAADHVDPATLRGMGPDQTLVLINGKRRHQSSAVNIYGTRGRGNTGTDLNAIPVAAIDRIEILRDGASAQYGSDAIAGVINIVLKSDAKGFTSNFSSGAYNANAPSKYSVLHPKNKFDGETFQGNFNFGAPIKKDGFINVTTEFLGKDFTFRSTDESKFDSYRRKFGDAAIDNYRTFFNLSVPISETSNFYAFGGYNFRNGKGYAFSRYAGDPSNVDQIYPNGFDPLITSRIVDKSLSIGVKNNINDWIVDFGNTFGSNKFHFIIDKTLNASLLVNSPTRFDAGGYGLNQNTTNLSASRYFKDALSGINLAFGTEYRIENYKIFAGEEASYRNYGVVDSVGANGFLYKADTLHRPAGSQGFPGFGPANVVDAYRQNIGLYIDNEINFTKSFLIAVAGRFERYSDFGNTLNGKFATRLALNDYLAVRAAASTGFRAPSLAQIYFNSTFSDVLSGKVFINTLAGNNSGLTRTLGIPKLKQETATNYSLGLTFNKSKLSATIDGYYVAVKNRIVLTGYFFNDDPDIGPDLQTLGLSAARFFTNAVNTTTKGIDAVVSYDIPIGRNPLRLTFSGNFNSMKIDAINVAPKLVGKEDTYFSKREQYFLLASAPRSKMNLSANYKIGKFTIYSRATRYGAIVLKDYGGFFGLNEADERHSPKVQTDVTVGYNLSPNINVSLGGTNIFNIYPDQHDSSLTESGGVWEAVQMGFSGAFYFCKLAFKL